MHSKEELFEMVSAAKQELIQAKRNIGFAWIEFERMNLALIHINKTRPIKPHS